MKSKKVNKIGLVYVLTIVVFYLIVIVYHLGLASFMDSLLWGESIDLDLYRRLDNPFKLAGFAGMISLISIIPSIIYIFSMKLNLATIFGFVSIITLIFYFGIHINIVVIIPSYRYSTSNLLLFILLWILFALIVLFNILLKRVKVSEEDTSLVKKSILELSKKFYRLRVKEIAEKSKVDKDTIITTIKEMIVKKEIYAEYFKSSKTVSFNKEANIDEFDELLKSFEQYDAKMGGKKEKIN